MVKIINLLKKKNVLFSFIFAILSFFSINYFSFGYVKSVEFYTLNTFNYFNIIAYYFLFSYAINKLNSKKLKYSFVFSLILAIAYVLGFSLKFINDIFILQNIFIYIALLPILTALFTLLLTGLNVFIRKNKKIKKEFKFLNSNKFSFNLRVLVLFLCLCPCLLAFYPGSFTYDTITQTAFFLDPMHAEVNPLIHNILVYLVLVISKNLNSEFIGVLLYTISQMLIIAFIASYSINVLDKLKVNSYLKLFVFLFYCLHPVHHMFSVICTKDVLFSWFCLYFILLSIEFFVNKEEFLSRKSKIFQFILASFLVCIFRHNGYIGYLLFFAINAIYFLISYKKYFKKVFLLTLVPIVLFFAYGQIKNFIGVTPAPYASSLAIPLQQMGYVRLKHDKELPMDEKIIFRELVGKNEMLYTPYNADLMKIDSPFLYSNSIQNALNKDLNKHFSLYLKWFFKYPKDYINSGLILNSNYLYPNANYFTMGLHYYILTYNRWSDFFGVKISQTSLCPKLTKFYNSLFLNCAFEKVPFVALLFSLPIILWSFIICFVLLLYKRKYDFAVISSFYLALIFTVLLGPVTLLRYIYPILVAMPLFISLTLSNTKFK